MSNEEIQAILRRAAADLGEHFDAVQIVASRIDEKTGSTTPHHAGTGNWFARRGLCQQFIEMDQADTAARAIGPAINPPDEGEKWREQP